MHDTLDSIKSIFMNKKKYVKKDGTFVERIYWFEKYNIKKLSENPKLQLEKLNIDKIKYENIILRHQTKYEKLLQKLDVITKKIESIETLC